MADEVGDLRLELDAAREEQAAVARILAAMSHSPFEISSVFESITESAVRLSSADNASLFRREGERYRHVASAGAASDEARAWVRDSVVEPGRASLTGRVAMERRPVQIPDVRLDAEYTSLRPGGTIRAILGVPILRGADLVGIVNARRYAPGRFSDRDVTMLETFAHQAAIAMGIADLYQTVERQRQELTRFLSPQVASLVTSDEGRRLLDGHRRLISVLFCDLRGFTPFSETAEPEEVLGVLRAFHGAMGELIVAHGGTLEHFAGDGMMIFFNDPVQVAEHELQAVHLALAMRSRFDELRQSWQRLGYELGLGIGAAVGHATLGRIGFEGRYDYGAVGNAVIVASRLSGEAKAGQILVTQRLHAAVEDRVDAETIGELMLKGQTRPVTVFSVVGSRPAAVTARQR